MHHRTYQTFFYLCVFLTIQAVSAFSQSVPETAFESAIQFGIKAPTIMKPDQVFTDLNVFEHILRESYGHFEIQQSQGHDWEKIFANLRDQLLKAGQPVLVHHFLEQLMRSLDFTGDPFLRGEIQVLNRNYVEQIKALSRPFYVPLRMASYQGRFRAMPHTEWIAIANQWLVGCKPKNFRYFPVLPDRAGESLSVFGVFSESAPDSIHCIFVNDLDRPREITLSMQSLDIQNPLPANLPVFEWKDGDIPYIRWYRDSSPYSGDTRQFLKLAQKLQNYQTLIVDVRGNVSGSFGYIEKWLQQITRNSWSNVIIREKQSALILRGLLNRLDWLRYQQKLQNFPEAPDLAQKQQQIQALIDHLRDTRVAVKWIETKFIFQGSKESPPWNKNLIIIANQHCGSGCQFLAGLAKQQENAWLIGGNTGVFPRTPLLPLYQLPQSKILLTINHTLHLDHAGQYVKPSGHEPDYWMAPPDDMNEIFRFARSLQKAP
ncbi:MAG: peptidase S41 [SAR324 cluster bacterium]|nr:peptidase S41 [SAR324 cluster bacterium]